MRARWLVVAGLAAVVVLYLLRTVGGSGDSDRPSLPRRPPPAVSRAAESSLTPTPAMRNVFEYADGGARVARVEGTPVAPRTPAAPVAPLPSPSPLVRLVGLLRRGGQLRAALAVYGETVVLAAGESAAGYTVVSLDEDEGVRLRAPDGSTIVLPPAGE